jgi:cytochrome oxidase Cu insertion factor (SCO1/SenC/PrrC family)
VSPPPGAQDVPKPSVPKRLDEAEQRKYFTDLPLLTQDGKPVKFYTDVLKGKLVLISFIYTNCTDICPILMHNLVDVQEKLGEKFGKDVFFVSISVDPEDDTPEELKKYAERYEAKPGWTFLTGKKENVDWVIYKLGQYTADFEDHSMTFLLGDVKNAKWAKLKGESEPEVVSVKIREFLLNREAGGDSLKLVPR